MENVFIYSLKDPRTGEIRYVGKTIKPKKRLNSHIARSKNRNLHSSNWIKSIIDDGFVPIMEILEICNSDNWEEREKFWILKYSEEFKLTNISQGGGSEGTSYGFRGKKHTAESIQKMKDSRTGVSINQRDPEGKRIEAIKKYNESRKIKIIQYDIDGNFIKIWDSWKDAGTILKLSQDNIRSACNGNRKMVGSYQWRYYKENYNTQIEKYSGRMEPKPISDDMITKTISESNGLKEASMKLGISIRTIRRKIKNIKK